MRSGHATSSWRSATSANVGNMLNNLGGPRPPARRLGSSHRAPGRVVPGCRRDRIGAGRRRTCSAPSPRCAWRATSWRLRSDDARKALDLLDGRVDYTARDRHRRSSPSAAPFSRRAEPARRKPEIRAARAQLRSAQLARPRGRSGDAPRRPRRKPGRHHMRRLTDYREAATALLPDMLLGLAD